MPIRLIAIDIDGTLLDSRGALPDANREAIEAATAQGVEIVLATGRSFGFARPIAAPLPDTVTLLVSNGALVKTKAGESRLRRLLPRDVAREVLSATRDFRQAAGVIFDREHESLLFEGIDWEHPNRRGFFEKNRAHIGERAPLEDCLTEDPIQVMFNGTTTGMRELRELLFGLPAAARFDVALTEYAHRDFSLLDVMAKGCSKGSGLAAWAALRGYDREEVMAVGDNFNDCEMLEFAGVPVVMGNAVPELKTRGWRMTGPNDESGLARAIEDLVLNPSILPPRAS